MDTLASSDTQSWLGWFLRGVLFLGLGVLLVRAFELQIIKGDYFRALSEDNRIKRLAILAPRGKIFARGGELLVGNVGEVKDQGDVIVPFWRRDYPLGSGFAHAGGYVGEVNEDEVNKVDGGCPEKGPRKIGSLTGRSGLELEYECSLRGFDGEELIEVDTQGRKVRTLGIKKPTPGEDIHTTIDYGLQTRVAEIFAEYRGAVVATDPKGEVLALYSSPSYDPGDVSGFLDDEGLPLFDRAVAGGYHPGSTFKIVTSAAGLEEGKIDKDYLYNDQGAVIIQADPSARVPRDYVFTNWYFSQYGKTEGQIGVVRAIARSTDTFFYELGRMLGIERLSFWAKRFGLGQKTGIDIPGEINGVIPTPDWKKEVKGEQWFLGDTINMSIGQGDVSVTPLQINTMTSVIASGGKLCKPCLGDKCKTQVSRCKDLGLKSSTIQLIKDGMAAACSNGGTAFPFFSWNGDQSKPKVACKTGTAETNKEGTTHAWFTMFSPSDNPEIVVTVLVEEGGEGSSAAAPIARAIMDYWYLQQNP